MHPSYVYFAVSSSEVVTSTLRDSWAWYVIRASGLVSLTLLVLLMISGIGHVTGWTYRLFSPVKAWSVHKAMAITLAVSIAIHMLGLLADHYVNFSLAQIFVPFLKNYSNGTSLFGLHLGLLAIPAGILAAYGAYVVIFSSLDTVGWISKHKRLWKWTHVISYAVMVLVVFHVLNSGTDFKESFWRLILLVTFIVLIIAVAVRILRMSLFSGKNKANKKN